MCLFGFHGTKFFTTKIQADSDVHVFTAVNRVKVKLSVTSTDIYWLSVRYICLDVAGDTMFWLVLIHYSLFTAVESKVTL